VLENPVIEFDPSVITRPVKFEAGPKNLGYIPKKSVAVKGGLPPNTTPDVLPKNEQVRVSKSTPPPPYSIS
jgi:hypothetical protein